MNSAMHVATSQENIADVSDTTRKEPYNVYRKESKAYRVVEYRKCRKHTARMLRCGASDESSLNDAPCVDELLPLPRRTSGWLTH